MSQYVSPYSYRTPPDTFLYRRDPRWYIGAASAPPAPGHKLPLEVIQSTVVALVKMNQQAQALADKAVEETNFLSRPAMREWATNFKESVQQMVVRLITVNKNGLYPWEVTPKLVADVADYIESTTKEMKESREELLSVAGNFRQLSKKIADGAADALATAAKAVADAAEQALKQSPLGTAAIAGGILAVIALYFVIKK